MHRTFTTLDTSSLRPFSSEDGLGRVKAIAILTLALGLVVLFGWALNIDALKSLLPGLVSMKANTAAAFALSGIGLYLHTLQQTPPAILLVRQMAATLIMLIGLVTLSEYFFNWNAGIDQLLFSEPAGAVLTSHPGRMATITATNFTLIGSALLLMEARCWMTVQATALAVAVFALLPLGGYMFGNLSLTQIGSTTAIAAHTAVCFLMLVVGILLVTQTHGFVVVLRKKSRVIGLTSSLVALVFMFSAMFYNFAQKDKASQLVEHTYKVIQSMETFSVGLHDFLFHSRGLLIAGDDRQLAEMDKARIATFNQLAKMYQLTSGGPAQTVKLDALDKLVAQRIEWSDMVMQVRHEKGQEAAVAMEFSGMGNNMTDKIEAKLDELKNTEKTLLKEQQKIIGIMNSSSWFAMGVLLAISLLLLLSAFRASQRRIVERMQAEAEIRNLAIHDTLTKLPNLRLFTDRLSQAIASSKRSGCHGALMILDLDNFKLFNYTHGYEVGDLLLIEAANRLKVCVREMDTVVRLGGDNFGIMLSELDADKAEATSQTGIVAERIRTALSAHYLLPIKGGQQADSAVEYHCTASTGVALFVRYDASQDDIIKWADTAMYQAKEAGRNSIRFYESTF